MISKSKIKNLLKKKILILDGAVGTELQKRGMPEGVSPELWCMDNPNLLSSIHAEYKKAGAQIIYTSTFGANRIKLAQYNTNKVKEVNKNLAILARNILGKDVLIAGDIGPTGRFISPFGDLDFEDAVDIFKEQAKGLLEGGVDLFVIETMIDIQEARAALLAVKELADIFTIVSMTYDNSNKTLNGTDPLTALVTLQSLGADTVGANCSSGPEGLLKIIEEIKPYSYVPILAKPNAGLPKLFNNKTIFDMEAREFASFSKKLAKAGANLLGGCCGTTPSHIHQLKKAVTKYKPVTPILKVLPAVSSLRKTAILKGQLPLIIAGERINPTGKKTFQEELLEGKLTFIRKITKEQEKQGASLLDVNVSMPSINEKRVMLKTIELLVNITELPLIIDSSDPVVLEAALRFYPGRAIINSISGEKHKLNKLLPIVKKYGAMFILLPLDESGIPDTAEQRKIIIQKVFQKVKEHKLNKNDLIVDSLVIPASSHPCASMETLKTINWCTDKFKCLTIIGLSNVSFGLPHREWLNATFLAMAQYCGLTMVIANPASGELLNIKTAADLLTNKDKNAALFISHFQNYEKKEGNKENYLSYEEKIEKAILDGAEEDIEDLIKKAINQGTQSSKLLNGIMIPAIIKVGCFFDKKEYFLPQLIASAEAMKKGLTYLEPYLKKDDAGRKDKTAVLLATVKGDIHDIGKNIVALILRNYGFNIIDLGKDVSAEKIISAIKRYNPAVVGLSALMTTTMINMKDVIDLAKKNNLHSKFIVGGAVLTKSYASSIGAEYAKDGVEAVRVIKELASLGERRFTQI